MGETADSFFDGLDDAEEVATPDAPEAPAPDKPEEAAPEAAKPEEKAPEAKAPEAAKPDDKPAEPAPEKPAAPEAKAPEIPDPKKWVPVGSHIELRRQLQATQEELQRLKNPPKPAEPPAPKPEAPDFVQDPKGYVDHRVQAALEKLDEAVKPVAQTAEQAAAQTAHVQLLTTINTAEQSFVARQPDYYNALQHLRSIRANELQMLHPEATQEQIGEAMRNEELALAANLLRSGRNPSEIAYTLAKQRGYAPPKPPEPAKPEPKPAALEEVAKLVPKVPETPKLSPDLTLGTGTGSPTEDISEDPFDAAFREVFGRKRA